jgi:hypothetical protein
MRWAGHDRGPRIVEDAEAFSIAILARRVGNAARSIFVSISDKRRNKFIYDVNGFFGFSGHWIRCCLKEGQRPAGRRWGAAQWNVMDGRILAPESGTGRVGSGRHLETLFCNWSYGLESGVFGGVRGR